MLKRGCAWWAYGSKWFHFLCGRHELDPKEHFTAWFVNIFQRAQEAAFTKKSRGRGGNSRRFLFGPDRESLIDAVRLNLCFRAHLSPNLTLKVSLTAGQKPERVARGAPDG